MRNQWMPTLPSELVPLSHFVAIICLLCSLLNERMLLLLGRFSRVRLCATPQTAAHKALPSLGFSRQEHWSGLPSRGIQFCLYHCPMHNTSFPGGSDGKASACNAGHPGVILALGRSRGEGNGNPLQDSCWRIPRMEEPGGLQSVGLQKVGRDWATCHFQCIIWSFLGGASGKELACQCRRCKRHGFNPWVRKIPWRRAWQPTRVLLPGEFQGERSLVGYSP